MRDQSGKLVVDRVQPESPAAKAGIKSGDLLTHLDGEPVKSPEALRDALQTRGPAETMTLTLQARRGTPGTDRSRWAATSRPRTVAVRAPYLGIVLNGSDGRERDPRRSGRARITCRNRGF